MNLASLVLQHPEGSKAFNDGTGWSTWGEIRSRVASAAESLISADVKPDDRVAIVLPTSIDFVVAYLAVLAVGAVAVPLNPLNPAASLNDELKVTAPSVVIAVGSASDAVASLDVAALGINKVFSTADEVSQLLGGGSATNGSVPTLAPVERSEGDLAALLFTSGTAGAPKAAMLTHGNLLSNLQQMLEMPSEVEMIGHNDIGLAAVPLFHIFGLNVALGLSIATGGALVLAERFDPEGSIDIIRTEGITLLTGAPVMFAVWCDMIPEESKGNHPLPSVRAAMSGAAPLSPEVAERFEKYFGVPLWQGYGLTEAGPGVSSTVGGESGRASIGRPLPGVEIVLVDDDGEPVLEGDPGEIWVRGKNIFAGYFNDPDTTSSVLTNDGWLKTGDIAVMAEGGDLFIVDRKKDLVIVNGFNVFPAEVERVVEQVEGVSEAVAVGRADPVTGESIEIVVVPRFGAELTVEDVLSRCSSRLPRYKCPTSVRFVSDLPRGLTGKALRRVLREQVS